MSAGQCLPIKSAASRPLAPGIVSRFLTLLFFSTVTIKWTNGIRITQMKAPLVVDFREEIELECEFSMGADDLYAVKWYKDEQEFFRFTPGVLTPTSFPVPGVHLVLPATNCNSEHCKIQLKDLSRYHSGGAYRCEISSEAPAFRQATQTRNITVAALPRENPRIEGLATSYTEGDVVEAKCVSDPADPTPILSWYINGIGAPSKFVGDMISSEPDNLGLASRSLTLQFLAERKYSRGDSIELRCMSSLPGVPLAPQETTVKIPLRAPETQVINNQKLHWFNSPSTATNFKVAWIFIIVSFLRWSIELFQAEI